jgi:hypothetical protein
MEKLIEKYNQNVAHPSDINRLLPFLHEYSKGFEHITEFGVRQAVSTYAFIMSKPKKLVGYDISRQPEIDELEEISKESGVEFEFVLKDVLKTEIEETDVLFIDTYHVAGQCAKELALHASKVKHRIMFHDIAEGTYWETGEAPYEGLDHIGLDTRGLKYAIEPFMESHPEWKEIFRTQDCNGLLVLERQK